MKIPNGHTETEVLDIIRKIAKKLAYKFIFPPYEHADVEQEAIIIGIEGLENYDEKYPLEAFLRTHIKHRLCNFKRKNYMRLNKPCLNCPFQAYVKRGDLCTKFKEKEDCELYVAWVDITERKKNILAPIRMEKEHLVESSIPEQLSHQEIINLIDKNIPLELRALWLQLKGGAKLTRTQMEQIKAGVQIILEENNINGEEWA